MRDAYVIVERWSQFFNQGDADALAGLYAHGGAWLIAHQHSSILPKPISG